MLSASWPQERESMLDLLPILRKSTPLTTTISHRNAPPSFVEESELAAITGPLSIAAAETDQIFPAEKRHKSETILIETKQPYQINLFSGVVHGFSVRCDVSKKVERFAKEQAFLQAVNWFNEHLI
jgi:dienelactone hydrolase